MNMGFTHNSRDQECRDSRSTLKTVCHGFVGSLCRARYLRTRRDPDPGVTRSDLGRRFAVAVADVAAAVVGRAENIFRRSCRYTPSGRWTLSPWFPRSSAICRRSADVSTTETPPRRLSPTAPPLKRTLSCSSL